MDKSILVASGHALIDALSDRGIAPRAVIWVYTPEIEAWKLWVVPHRSIIDKREFYRHVSEIITKNRDKFGGIDAGDIEMILENHPAIRGLSRVFRVPVKSDVQATNNMLNGFYLPDCIILLLAL